MASEISTDILLPGLSLHLDIDLNVDLDTEWIELDPCTEADGGCPGLEDETTVEIWDDNLGYEHPPSDPSTELGSSNGGEGTGGSEAPECEDDEIVGDPLETDEFWFQQAVNGWCGPASAAEIIAEATGSTNLEATELEVVARASELGLLTHDGQDITAGWSGMYPEDVATLLESFGIPAAAGNGTLEDLESAIEAGDRVIVAVESGVIWNDQGDLGLQYESGYADHALVVTAIDHENGVVYLNDPGRPDGAACQVSLEAFEEAWAAGGNAIVVADMPEEPVEDGGVVVPPIVIDFETMLHEEGQKNLLLPITLGELF